MASGMPEQIKAYLEKLLADKGIKGISPELAADMVESLYKRLQAYLFTDLTKNISAALAKELNQKMEQGLLSEEQALEWLTGRVKNINEILAKSMIEFRDIYLRA